MSSSSSSEELANALVELKLAKAAIEEKDAEIQLLSRQVVTLQQQQQQQELKSQEMIPAADAAAVVNNRVCSNWDETLALLDVPFKVIDLQQNLQEEPDRIVSIQDEWERFVAWRYDALQQLSGVDTSASRASTTTSLSPIDLVADQFSTIDQLGRNVCNVLWNRLIVQCFDPSVVSVSVLTDCFSIIRRTDDRKSTEHDQVIKSAMYQIHCLRDDGLLEYESLTHRCETVLTNAIRQQCQHTFHAIMQPQKQKQQSSSGSRSSSSSLIKSFYLVKDALVCCMFSSRFVSNVSTQLASELTKQFGQLQDKIQAASSSIDIYTIFRLTQWIHQSQHDAKTLDLSAAIQAALEDANLRLTNVYLDMIQQQVRDANQHLVRHTYSPKRMKTAGTDGYFYTDVVEELIEYVTQQVSMLQQYLSRQQLREAVHLCLTIFQARQQYQHDDLIAIHNSNLEAAQLPMTRYLHHLCAVVNDNYRIQTEMMSIYGLCHDMIEVPTECDLLQQFMHEIAQGFDQVVTEAIDTIACLIFREIQEAVLDIFFTDRWLLGTCKPILMVLSTIDDYCIDLEQWVQQPALHLVQLRQCCVETLLRVYLERLLVIEEEGEKHPIEFQPDNLRRVGERMLQDQAEIQQYCVKYDLPPPFGDDKAIQILNVVAMFFQSTEPWVLFPDFAQEFGPSAVGPVLQRLIRYRKDDLSKSQQERMQSELKEWEMWAAATSQHQKLEHHPMVLLYPAASTNILTGGDGKRTLTLDKKRVQQLIGKGIQKAKAKRSSIVRGVQLMKIKNPLGQSSTSANGHSNGS